MGMSLSEVALTEGPTSPEGEATEQRSLDDLLALVVAGVGSDIPAPRRVEIEQAGSNDVMVRVYPPEGDGFDGYALHWEL